MFGSICYALGPKPQQSKLTPKSDKCIFVGYAKDKKHLVYNIRTKTVVSLCDVVFDESDKTDIAYPLEKPEANIQNIWTEYYDDNSNQTFKTKNMSKDENNGNLTETSAPKFQVSDDQSREKLSTKRLAIQTTAENSDDNRNIQNDANSDEKSEEQRCTPPATSDGTSSGYDKAQGGSSNPKFTQPWTQLGSQS